MATCLCRSEATRGAPSYDGVAVSMADKGRDAGDLRLNVAELVDDVSGLARLIWPQSRSTESVASEAKRGMVRLLANYGQLFANMILGIWLIRLLFQSLGDEGFGSVGLLGSTVGIAAIVKDIVNQSMIRELGVAYHHKDPLVFKRTYNSALLLSCLAAVVAMAVFAAVFLVLVFIFKLKSGVVSSDAMRSAVLWFLVAKAVQTCVAVIVAPAFNMYLVTERMAFVNIWGVLDVVGRTVAAFVVVQTDLEPASGLILFGVLSAAAAVLIYLVAVTGMIIADHRLIPSPGSISVNEIRSIVTVGGWNVVMLAANQLQVQAGAFVMAGVYGLAFGNGSWSLATRLTAMTRRIAMATARGSDAVATRISSAGGDEAVRPLLYHSTRLFGFVIFPCVSVIFILAEPCINLLAGDRAEDPAIVTAAPILLRILVLGMAARGMANGWFRIFYGAGYIRRYAPIVLVGAILNPIIAIALIFVLPDKTAYTGAAWAYLFVFVFFNAGFAARAGAQSLGAGYMQLLRPLFRPLLLSLMTTPILLLAIWSIQQWRLWSLLGVVLVFGTAHLAFGYRFMLDRAERHRLTTAITRRKDRISRVRGK